MRIKPSAPPSLAGISGREVSIVWSLWAVVLAAVVVTYARLGPTELYHVSRSGLSGGFSRAIVVMNFPLAIVALPVIFIALGSLSARWWWIGGPAVSMCLLTAWPGVVDNADLDARPVNAIPALGVVAAFVLTRVAAARSGDDNSGWLPLDAIRVGVGAIVLLLSLPWLATEAGFFLPDQIFITERAITGSDGRVAAAVHLGHHHGLDGALLVICALLLSRVHLRPRRLSLVTTAYISLMFAYGATNFAQDFWHEQIQKRGLVDWKMPSALEPTITPIWLVILALTVATTLLIRHETWKAPLPQMNMGDSPDASTSTEPTR